jgi:hypothetical protein
MQEIKFRSYWKGINQMVYFENAEFAWEKLGRIGMFIPAIGGKLYMGESIDMQFTGLKSSDKGGLPIKDAYYGDIIRFYNTEGHEYIKALSWDDHMKCLMVGNYPYHQLYESGYIQPSKLEFEIIGNIYQNPELIKA